MLREFSPAQLMGACPLCIGSQDLPILVISPADTSVRTPAPQHQQPVLPLTVWDGSILTISQHMRSAYHSSLGKWKPKPPWEVIAMAVIRETGQCEVGETGALPCGEWECGVKTRPGTMAQ